MQNIDNELRNLCRQYGVNESELERLYNEGANVDQMRDVIRRRLTNFQRIYNFIKGGGLVEERIRELNRIQDIQNQLNTIHENLSEIGTMIANAVFGTEEGRVFLTKALNEQIEPVGRGLNFREAAISYGGIEEEWKKYLLQNLKKRETWENVKDNNRKNQLKEGFKKHIREKSKKSGSVFEFLITMVNKWLESK